jgi:outer membrane receptor for ferrienterochelin and colicin
LWKKYEKNEKKRRRKEEKKEEKREKKKIEKNLINNTIFSLTCVGVTHLIMSVGEYKKEELKIQ